MPRASSLLPNFPFVRHRKATKELLSERSKGRVCENRIGPGAYGGLRRWKSMKHWRLVMVPRAGVEPARPFGQRILNPLKSVSLSLTKRYEPVFTGLAVVKVSLRLVSYQHAPPHLSPIYHSEDLSGQRPLGRCNLG